MKIYSLENISICFIFVLLKQYKMKKIIAFAGSNSKTSINKELATYASSLVENVEVTILDLNNFNLPIYGVDIENENGIPDKAHKFLEAIKLSDGIVLSLADFSGIFCIESQCSTIFPFRSNLKKSIVTYSSPPGQI